MKVGDLISTLLFEAGYDGMAKKISAIMEKTPDKEVLCMDVMVWSDDVAEAAGDEWQSSLGILVDGIAHEGPLIMRLTVTD